MSDRLRDAAQAALRALDKINQDAGRENRWGGVFHAEIEQLRAALVEAREAEPPYRFDRYINGRLMAEGVVIERETTLTAAISVAARLASTGANGETPVLVLVASHPPRREWQSLTDEDIFKTVNSDLSTYGFARAIEAALKEKNHD